MYSMILAALVQLPAAPPCDDVVIRWNEATLQAIRAEKTPPPKATRNLAMVHVSIAEAVNVIYRTHSGYRVRLSAPPDAAPEAAAAIAGHRVLTELYPCRRTCFDTELQTALAAVPDGPGKSSGIKLGCEVAEEILHWRACDGSDRRVPYCPGNLPGQWQPTPPDFKPALLPGWKCVTPWAMTSVTQFPPRDPPPLNSSAYTAAYLQVKALGGTCSTARSPEQTQIAKFWADGEGTVTPPGHWNRIAQTVSRQRGLPLPENARLFALLNMAMADAAILCWECKYRYNFWRPAWAIPLADRDGNPDTTPDPCWTPLLPTPPFPAYTSGHSTFSATAATVLAGYFGSDAVSFATDSEGLPCVSRSFGSFWAAAEEAGWSRIYGGIHWEFDNLEGLAAGRSLGEYVVRNFLLPAAPTAMLGRPDISFATRRR